MLMRVCVRYTWLLDVEHKCILVIMLLHVNDLTTASPMCLIVWICCRPRTVYL